MSLLGPTRNRALHGIETPPLLRNKGLQRSDAAAPEWGVRGPLVDCMLTVAGASVEARQRVNGKSEHEAGA